MQNIQMWRVQTLILVSTSRWTMWVFDSTDSIPLMCCSTYDCVNNAIFQGCHNTQETFYASNKINGWRKPQLLSINAKKPLPLKIVKVGLWNWPSKTPNNPIISPLTSDIWCHGNLPYRLSFHAHSSSHCWTSCAHCTGKTTAPMPITVGKKNPSLKEVAMSTLCM